MAATKVCPECVGMLPWNKDICNCGYDFTAEECPGCDRRIPFDADICPHCHYNILAPTTTKAVKVAKPKKGQLSEPQVETKIETQIREVKLSAATDSHRHKIVVPALGRMCGVKSLEFPELHFHGEPTDDAFIEWAERLRVAWNEHDQNGWLSNHAIGCLAEDATEPALRENWRKIVQLLGGDDYD